MNRSNPDHIASFLCYSTVPTFTLKIVMQDHKKKLPEYFGQNHASSNRFVTKSKFRYKRYFGTSTPWTVPPDQTHLNVSARPLSGTIK